MIIVTFIVISGCAKENAPKQNLPSNNARHTDDSEIKEVSLAEIEESSDDQKDVKKILPKLLDLGAKKCIPCKKMAPILEELTVEYKGVFDVEFVDVWQPENKAIAAKHQIRSIPTQIFFNKDGERLWTHEGFISKEDILKKWEELGYQFKASSENTQ
ncbi:thioredoxin family protein [Planctomycetota bacterium]|nr:thioredoxin family protein [Planctomycetota bacterium]